MSKDFFVVVAIREGGLLASNWERSRILLTIFQWTLGVSTEIPIVVNFRNCDIRAAIRMNNRIQRDNGGTIKEERPQDKTESIVYEHPLEQEFQFGSGHQHPVCPKACQMSCRIQCVQWLGYLVGVTYLPFITLLFLKDFSLLI